MAEDALTDPHAVAFVGGAGAGLGGRLRETVEDFRVEEIPLVRPSGHGGYALVQIEKRATSTFDVLLFLSKAAKVSERAIGYAGLKDARAVTTQYLSLPKVPPERLAGVTTDRFRVLSATRSELPLKIGHLRGNRFTIRIRGADLGRFDAAAEALERLVARGMPNAYGRQRFGTRLDGHCIGRAMVWNDWPRFLEHLLGRPSPLERNPRMREARAAFDRGDLDAAFETMPLKHRTEKKALGLLRRGGSPRDVFEQVGKGPRRIWLSAWQSFLFNRVLDARVRDGTFDTPLPGDVAWLHASGACHPVREETLEADRAHARIGEASPTGPLVGYDLRLAEGSPGRLEREVFERYDVEVEDFRAAHCRARGQRRPLRVPVREASLRPLGADTVEVRFVLPPGVFATVLLAHLMAS